LEKFFIICNCFLYEPITSLDIRTAQGKRVEIPVSCEKGREIVEMPEGAF